MQAWKERSREVVLKLYWFRKRAQEFFSLFCGFLDADSYRSGSPYVQRLLRAYVRASDLFVCTIVNLRRYLILTYAVEFDRVHYPLPLSYVDEPPAHALRATIRRLR